MNPLAKKGEPKWATKIERMEVKRSILDIGPSLPGIMFSSPSFSGASMRVLDEENLDDRDLLCATVSLDLGQLSYCLEQSLEIINGNITFTQVHVQGKQDKSQALA